MTTPPSSPRAVSPPLLSYPPRAVGRSCRPLAIPLMLPHPRPRPRLLFVPSRRSRPLALTSLIAPSDARAPAPSCRSPSPRFAVSPTLACAPHSRPSSGPRGPAPRPPPPRAAAHPAGAAPAPRAAARRPRPRAAHPLPVLPSRPPWHARSLADPRPRVPLVLSLTHTALAFSHPIPYFHMHATVCTIVSILTL
jgi:hypothetical protein